MHVKPWLDLYGYSVARAIEPRMIWFVVISGARGEGFGCLASKSSTSTGRLGSVVDVLPVALLLGASVHGGVGPFGLLVMASADLEEHTAVFFRVFRHLDTYKVLMCTDLTKSSTKEGVHKTSYGAFLEVDVEKDKFLSLRTLIDHTVVESFGDGGRTCMTARVYPEHVATSSSRLYVFNKGTCAVKVSKLEAWELATAAMNGGASSSIEPDRAL
ncbi:beta-fructofuranosidase, insoluble isoenzyme 7-like [Lolium rigidum]|uniref:beta-fructofuranosidase, insoluble isoenzyme 7-like n=1 Tax=Lolium rigidum TaxID=89674 RepID=UPI001F5C3EC7|nr:beta-fructofuranosidase, insoluble isoenzyme 7-like [Lolium rigidum]